MLTAAAAWLVAAGLFGFVAAMDGDVLLGWAAILTALAGVIAAVGTSVANLRKTAQVQAAVGPPNGRTIQQVLYQLEANQHDIKETQHDIKEFESYVHGRNHDLLNAVGTLVATQPTQTRLIELLLARLERQEND